MNTIFNQNKMKATLVEMLTSLAGLNKECEFYRFEHEDGSIFRQGLIGVDCDEEDIFVIFSIPQRMSTVFVMATDGPIALARKVIANFEEMAHDDPINLGCVRLIDSSELMAFGVVGFMVLPIAASNVLGELPSGFDIDGCAFSFNLIVPISEKEYLIWKQFGYDQLMDYFSESEKDLISFHAD